MGGALYYDVFSDEVAVDRKWHELLEATPPWDMIAGVDPAAAGRAISGLRYHFLANEETGLVHNLLQDTIALRSEEWRRGLIIGALAAPCRAHGRLGFGERRELVVLKVVVFVRSHVNSAPDRI